MDQKRSAVWLHFGIISNEKAKCNLCKNMYSYKNGSMSNSRKHMKNKPPTMILDETKEIGETEPRENKDV